MASKLVFVVAAGSAAASNFDVKTAMFWVDDRSYVCPGTGTQVFYPDGPGKFPVVVYLHGSGGGLEGCDNALETVASYGLIVIAPITGGYDGDACRSGTAHEDIFRAMRFAQWQGSQQVPVLDQQADWSKFGIWGLSMGGKAATRAASYSWNHGLRLRALVASHGARESGSVPAHTDALFITSTEDESSSPPELMYRQYRESPARRKVYVNLQGQDHMEPCAGAEPPGPGLMNHWVAKFLQCSLSGKHCDEVYGGALCEANPYHACHVHDSLGAQRPVFV